MQAVTDVGTVTVLVVVTGSAPDHHGDVISAGASAATCWAR